ncbi:MAG TPA: HDOD domain-containing protein, partial [Verrucomicrobiae bacterium]|nr:HDOD domain-containing protein [Verrucomicrobiae bacterium]
NPECSSEELGEIVSTDPALTTKLLQLVNSAFMGFAREVASAEEAVMLLGTGTIRSLALGLHAFSAFKSSPRTDGILQTVWDHSARVARLAERLTRLEGGDDKMAEEAFTAGLLHDVGKLLLVDNQAEAYLQMLSHGELDGAKLIEAEHAAFSATHAEVGAYLLDLWGLPLPLVEAVAYHHEPARAGHLEPGALTFVHAANALEHEAPNLPPASTMLDLDYLERLSFASRVADWRQELAEL